jgi:phosphatidylserine/phosphatidylglycerophosphate/cardiolipin synthase-like enzyme
MAPPRHPDGDILRLQQMARPLATQLPKSSEKRDRGWPRRFYRWRQRWDEYLGLNPKFGRWRDTHVRVKGPSAMQLQLAFAADWFFATGEALAGHWDAKAWPDIEGEPALVLSSDQFERCTLFFLNVIAMAERRLWIASPYFVPDEGIL